MYERDMVTPSLNEAKRDFTAHHSMKPKEISPHHSNEAKRDFTPSLNEAKRDFTPSPNEVKRDMVTPSFKRKSFIPSAKQIRS